MKKSAIEDGTIACCPCIGVQGYRVRVEVSVCPTGVRLRSNHLAVVDSDEALEFLSNLQAEDMRPIKDALIQLWQAQG